VDIRENSSENNSLYRPEAVPNHTDEIVPKEPKEVEDTGIHRDDLEDLVLRTACTVRGFTIEWVAKQVGLPLRIVNGIVERLQAVAAVEIVGQAGTLSFKMRVTEQGRRRGAEAMRASGYLGPAPVTVEDYSTMLEAQLARMPQIEQEEVSKAIDELVLPPNVVEVAGLARSSGRSLFLWGPPGNGKTSIGHLVHNAVKGDLWIPYCLGVGRNIIKLFDPQCHQVVEDGSNSNNGLRFDRRWVKIRRPFVVVAGELRIEALDLAFHPVLRYYEAPMHLKANGGTFLIDDFGCQRADPLEILHRWVLPLERHVDYLTLQTGQQVPVPFKQMLILSTNLDPEEIMDAAFLRRMGYRLYLGYMSPDQYAQIFKRYAAGLGLTVPEGMLERLFSRYSEEGRPLRGSEPRDLIERCRDICNYRNQSIHISEDLLNTAWRGYFGEKGVVR